MFNKKTYLDTSLFIHRKSVQHKQVNCNYTTFQQPHVIVKQHKAHIEYKSHICFHRTQHNNVKITPMSITQDRCLKHLMHIMKCSDKQLSLNFSWPLYLGPGKFTSGIRSPYALCIRPLHLYAL